MYFYVLINLRKIKSYKYTNLKSPNNNFKNYYLANTNLYKFPFKTISTFCILLYILVIFSYFFVVYLMITLHKYISIV